MTGPAERARLDAVFGETEPAVTADERDPRDGHDPGRGAHSDRWWDEQRPPHHG